MSLDLAPPQSLLWTKLVNGIANVFFSPHLIWVCGLWFLGSIALAQLIFHNSHWQIFGLIWAFPPILSSTLTCDLFINFAEAILLDFPQQSPLSSQAIAILGRGPAFQQARADLAVQLWQANLSPQIFISGNGDAPILKKILISMGIPANNILIEEHSRTTLENAKFSHQQLFPLGIKKIILISDPWHLLRAYLTFQNLGFIVLPISSPENLTAETRKLLVIRELIALVNYKILGRLP